VTANDDRLAFLRAKTEWSDEEFAELIALSPIGTFRRFPNLSTAGLHNLEQAVANFVEVGERATHAYQVGCYIEVLTLRSQSAELFLRVYLAAKLALAPSFPANDKRPLGALIKECEVVGLDSATIESLRKFNTDRISVVHHYLLGSQPYDALRNVCDQSRDLIKDLVAVLSTDVGEAA